MKDEVKAFVIVACAVVAGIFLLIFARIWASHREAIEAYRHAPWATRNGMVMEVDPKYGKIIWVEERAE